MKVGGSPELGITLEEAEAFNVSDKLSSRLPNQAIKIPCKRVAD
jgi:hypothetical protein